MPSHLVKWTVAAVLLATAALAAPPLASERSRPARPSLDWARPAPLAAQAVVEPAHDPAASRRPAVLIQTSRYHYLAGEAPEVFMSVAPNGYPGAVTLWLYRQDRVTGERSYYSAPGREFHPTGVAADLFGTAGVPVAIHAPALDAFPLFGPGSAFGDAPAEGAPTGRYQWVVEVRDAAGRSVLSRSNAMYNRVSELVNVTTDVTTDATWTADKVWYLNKRGVFVRSGATLTIEPGTVVIGSNAQSAALVVERGARMIADGTPRNPIVFTSELPAGERGRAQWGGLVINGAAKNNVSNDAEGEGQTGFYGGENDDDDSGVYRYLRVEYAGIEFSPDNELNGIAFQSVGRRTVIDHVQVHYNKDDGVEFFGGTAQAKYVLLTGIGDDSLDWTDGWRGKLQYVVAVQDVSDADQGIEADNNGDNQDAAPRSNPTIFNMTLIGAPGSTAESDIGMLIREGTAGRIQNGIVAHFGESHVAIDQDETFAQAAAGNLVIDNMIFWNNAFGFRFGDDHPNGPRTEQFITGTMKHNRVVDPMLADPLDPIRPDVEPLPGSPALDARYVASPPDDGFFDTDVDFLGGVRPGHNWTFAEWTTWARN